MKHQPQNAMKHLNKKRIHSLEKMMTAKKSRPRCATVCFDPYIPHFDSNTLKIDADVVLILPDNGRRSTNEHVPKGSYNVTYN